MLGITELFKGFLCCNSQNAFNAVRRFKPIDMVLKNFARKFVIMPPELMVLKRFHAVFVIKISFAINLLIKIEQIYSVPMNVNPYGEEVKKSEKEHHIKKVVYVLFVMEENTGSAKNVTLKWSNESVKNNLGNILH